MSFLYAIIIGIVQGLTEFLPVSSSGHLVLLNSLFGVQENFLAFSILLHIATLLAVVITFKKTIWEILKKPLSSFALKIYLSFIPTFVIVLLLRKFIEDSFSGLSYISICFLVTALILMISDFFAKENKNQFKKEVSFKSAIFMGVAQGLACFPGISRSGSTICTGLLLGEDREETAKFSFIMSIPVILASLVYELIFSGQSLAIINEFFIFGVFGFISAFLVGMIAIKFMVKIIKRAKYIWFSLYLIALSLLVLFLS